MKPLWIVRRLGARVVAIKCCTVPCQRISFARLYSGQTLFPFSCTVRPNWAKNVLIVFFCLVSQTKSFSMSKCIDPWVDEVACSIKNLVSSLNRLFNVLIKICLYLSFSMTLSFLQFHTLLLPTSNIFRFQCQHSLSRWKSQYSHKTTQFSSYLLEHYAAKRVGK